MSTIYKDIFTQAGLSTNEAIVYEYLLKNGKSPAGQIIKKTPLKRGVTYLALSELIKKGLISESKKNNVAYFIPNHPEQLRTYIEDKQVEISKAAKTLETNLSSLISDFNLVSGKPGIRYFEGIKGIEKVLEDSLTSKEVIYTYADIEAIAKYIDDINKKYVVKRDKLGVIKKGLVFDSPAARQYLKNYGAKLPDTKIIDRQKENFGAVMQIYDGKVSYITLSEKNMIGVIIENPNIYRMHKILFEHTWETAKKFDQFADFSKAQ